MWRDEWNKLIAIIAATAIGGLVVGTAKGLIQRRYGGWWQWASLLVAAMLVAVLVGLAVHDSMLSEAQQAAAIGVCAFLAEDLLLGLGALATLFARDPIGAVRRIWDALRGRRAS